MTEQMLRAKAADIQMMDEDQLFKFGADVDMSELDGKSKMYLYRAIEDRSLQLRDIDAQSGADVVSSEIKAGEL